VKHSLHQLRKKCHLGPKRHIIPPPAKNTEEVRGDQGMTSSTPFLVLMMICCKSFLKGASATNKLLSKLDWMSMKVSLPTQQAWWLSEDQDRGDSEALKYKGCRWYLLLSEG